jgi:hypothetical protein
VVIEISISSLITPSFILFFFTGEKERLITLHMAIFQERRSIHKRRLLKILAMALRGIAAVWKQNAVFQGCPLKILMKTWRSIAQRLTRYATKNEREIMINR